MGLSTNLWGKHGWYFIHFVALNYPIKPTDKDKKDYTTFLESLPDVLPCPVCGYHFRENLKSMPPNLNSREEFFMWTVDVHNFVNKMNGKDEVTYEEAYQLLQKKTNENDNLMKGLILSMSVVSLLVLFSYTVAKRL